MLVRWKSAFVAMLVVAAGFATAMDISDELSDELQMGWKMGLRPRQSSQNLQFFDESLGGAGAPAITESGDPDRPYSVEGDTFPDFETAADRACDTQKNDCAEAANNGGGSHEVSDCDAQNDRCKSGIPEATRTSFDDVEETNPEPVLVSSDANFDYFCDV